MEIKLSHDAIVGIARQIIFTLERTGPQYRDFRQSFKMTDADISAMRERILSDPRTGLNGEPIDVETYFCALFEVTRAGLLRQLELLRSAGGNEQDIVYLFGLNSQHVNSLTCLSLIVRGGHLKDTQARQYVSIAASENSNFRWKSDPAHNAKPIVKKYFEEWQALPLKARKKLYPTQVCFAMAMVTKVGLTEDGNPICTESTIKQKWIPEWRKKK